ncbi:hypothetical protein [Cytobacillus purgationiresistens]|uniref:Citrate synthase n=1 Tax=Cytobacillus purgationiresistens TaxID=863449 RepID=A0ABU0AEM3_9BACI|nr:hypothetical protein [Cytobacillus purgationiresistens]MDQ0269712.1 citrate synthase [Cytobacillus purgationiresistens]
MSECKIDHSHEEVKKKYESQKEFLPNEMHVLFDDFFNGAHTQDILNNMFHLLKKYDLASEDEKAERIGRLNLILKNI